MVCSDVWPCFPVPVHSCLNPGETKLIFFLDGSWNSEPQQVIKLGVLPVRSLLLVEGALWAASGGQVFMASVETHTIEVSAVDIPCCCSLL